MKINKPIVKICENGINKFYTPDGKRNKYHSTGFCFKDQKEWFLNNGYLIV